ncbi:MULTISPECIES: TlpA disulfide reductase family protein [unclassified Microbacterium]|uniref:TlpA disulfide reductase family protein n=1 Tax=unclassified Microbacterium TaxID=2609290 RepID=UPI00214C6CB0|nr:MULTISPECIES: TlpA disulfide reductase family protein [unclassified Microbacterium]MCR2810835.1 TlpA family protein disulfide reductase [Microbacterium sp. zg.B185]WIM19759.1 TlpA disulfide reductase family protein [Microbacterium sp. zg-B185]
MRRRRTLAVRRATAALVTATLALSLAACANDPLAEQYRAGDNKGYIAGDFRVVEIAADERTEPVVFEATTETGGSVTSADYLGGVLVVNFWYAACGPCRAEAGDLEEAYGQFQDEDVEFLGINTIDSAEQAAAFAETYGVTYPSAIASQTPSIKLAFAEKTPIQATPTTLVLDADGRVAARIIGQLPDASILTALVRDTLAESS